MAKSLEQAGAESAPPSAAVAVDSETERTPQPEDSAPLRRKPGTPSPDRASLLRRGEAIGRAIEAGGRVARARTMNTLQGAAGNARVARLVEHAAERPTATESAALNAGDERQPSPAALPTARTTRLVAQPRGGNPPTPAELAQQRLTQGPREQRRAWQREQRARAPRGAARVTVSTPHDNVPLKTVSDAEFRQEFRACHSARQEQGLPEAFLCTESSVGPIEVAFDGSQTVDTTIVVGGANNRVWVESVDFAWSLRTAGFLDGSRIEAHMFSATQTHEAGHRTIEKNIRDRLAALLDKELERVLPTERSPLRVRGSNWRQDGVDRVLAQVEGVVRRYEDWHDELSNAAHDAWDRQEQVTLSRIAAARRPTRQSTVPDVDDDDE